MIRYAYPQGMSVAVARTVELVIEDAIIQERDRLAHLVEHARKWPDARFVEAAESVARRLRRLELGYEHLTRRSHTCSDALRPAVYRTPR